MKLQTISDGRGHLTVAEKLPFEIKRAYWLHGINSHATRGGHAHKKLDRIMVALHGEFTVKTRHRQRMWWDTVRMDSPSVGLRLLPMTWTELYDFTPDAVCLVLASEEHDESDCIRDFAEFRRWRD